jgi:hypothetical protein
LLPQLNQQACSDHPRTTEPKHAVKHDTLTLSQALSEHAAIDVKWTPPLGQQTAVLRWFIRVMGHQAASAHVLAV